mmetsp:Transcript_9285/g.28151  ORF Transcript_9285/g.28151 Transcript_9285/m.28151 type:complete len:322 (-) Transcript_9285:66-1031(-)
MSSNGAFWPVGNIAMMKSLPDDHKPDNKYMELKPYQTSFTDVFNTVIGVFPKAVLALLLLPSFMAPLESGDAKTISFNWIWPIVARDLVGSYLICYGWEWLLYSSPLAPKMTKYKMNENYPKPEQIRHDQYHTFWCVLCASLVEVATLHLLSNGYFGTVQTSFFGAAMLCNLSTVAFTTYWRLTHFWFVHRMMHPWKTTVIPDVGKFLYKHVHSLHHKSYNPSTWAGLSMHPVEGTIYFTAAMLPALWGAHPYCFILCKLCLAIDSWVAHDGFGPPSAGVYYHYLHHAHFEINYGDTVMPLDYLFGSFAAQPPTNKKGKQT